jgi:hypothetical protein
MLRRLRACSVRLGFCRDRRWELPAPCSDDTSKSDADVALGHKRHCELFVSSVHRLRLWEFPCPGCRRQFCLWPKLTCKTRRSMSAYQGEADVTRTLRNVAAFHDNRVRIRKARASSARGRVKAPCRSAGRPNRGRCQGYTGRFAARWQVLRQSGRCSGRRDMVAGVDGCC